MREAEKDQFRLQHIIEAITPSPIPSSSSFLFEKISVILQHETGKHNEDAMSTHRCLLLFYKHTYKHLCRL